MYKYIYMYSLLIAPEDRVEDAAADHAVAEPAQPLVLRLLRQGSGFHAIECRKVMVLGEAAFRKATGIGSSSSLLLSSLELRDTKGYRLLLQRGTSPIRKRPPP